MVKKRKERKGNRGSVPKATVYENKPKNRNEKIIQPIEVTGIKKILKLISRYIKFNYITVVISIIIAIFAATVALLSYKFMIKKDQKELEMYIGDYKLEENQETALIYLYPTANINKAKFSAILPVKFKNKLENTIEDFVCEISTSIIEVTPRVPTVFNVEKKYKELRFFNTNEIVWDEVFNESTRGYQAFYNRNTEIVKYRMSKLIPDRVFAINEVFRVDTTALDDPEWGTTSAKDHLSVNLAYGYSNSKSFMTGLSILVTNFSSLDDFIKEIEMEGELAFILFKQDKKTKKVSPVDNSLILIPQFIDENKNSLTRELYTIYQYRYESKNFYYKRVLSLYDAEGNLVKKINFPDLDPSKTNRNAAMTTIFEKGID